MSIVQESGVRIVGSIVHMQLVNCTTPRHQCHQRQGLTNDDLSQLRAAQDQQADDNNTYAQDAHPLPREGTDFSLFDFQSHSC